VFFICHLLKWARHLSLSKVVLKWSNQSRKAHGNRKIFYFIKKDWRIYACSPCVRSMANNTGPHTTPHYTIPQQQHNSNNTKLNSLSISSFLNLVHTFILFYFIFCFFIKLLKTPSPLGPVFGLT
jgi:hypothetical protein